MDLRNKRVLLCGMARSGIAAAFLAKQKGAQVTIQDIKAKEQLGDLSELEEAGIEIYAGKNPDDIIETMDLVIVSPGIPGDLPFFEKGRKAGVPIISEVEFAADFTPCPLIAITGTNGKTTTTELCGQIMKAHFPETVVVGNIGVPFSSQVESLTEKSYVVAEISSFQMENTTHFHAHISAVLNITPDHLDRHKTLECYQAMKERVFMEATEADYTILNYSDEKTRGMAERTKGKVFFFSCEEVLEEGIFLKNNHIIIKWKEINVDFMSVDEMKILGIHNYENAMAAIAIGICAKVPLATIKEVVTKFEGVAHRIEFVGTFHGVDYYNDSKATNTDAAIRGITAMKKPCVLIGGGYDKGGTYDLWVEQFSERVKHLVLIGDTAEDILQCCKKHEFHRVTITDTLEEAVALCRSMAEEGDAVLLSPACASWGMFANYEERGDAFKAIVKRF